MGADTGRAAFIDRDGVINEELHYVHLPSDFRILPGAVEGMRTLQSAGFRLVVVTNQAGIARGLYTEDDFDRLTQHMRRLLLLEGVSLAGVYYCPHHPTHGEGRYRVDCQCRKPRPGMLIKAAVDLGLDLARSIIVGDKRSDVDAGRRAGLWRCALVTSGHPVSDADRAAADLCCNNLREAAHWIVAGMGSDQEVVSALR